MRTAPSTDSANGSRMIAKMTTRPPASVLAAFGVDAVLLQPLRGGQGIAWSAGELVLKPLGMSLDALMWQETVLSDITEDGFRRARPVRTRAGKLVVAGWSAWQRLAGQHLPDRWADIAAVGERFHRSSAHISPPLWHARRTDPFATADQAAWDAEALAPFRSLPPIDQLGALLQPVRGHDQLIHGDLSATCCSTPVWHRESSTSPRTGVPRCSPPPSSPWTRWSGNAQIMASLASCTATPTLLSTSSAPSSSG